MSTNSLIGIRENGYIRGIYCHWDGYPEWNGAILNAHYTSESKVKKLISLGSLSSLGERVSPLDGELHSFDNAAKGVTVAYHRARGEDLQGARRFKDTDMLKFDWGSYGYIFDVESKRWYTYKRVYTESTIEGSPIFKWVQIAVDYTVAINDLILNGSISKPRGWQIELAEGRLIKFTKRKMMMDIVYYSEDLKVPYSHSPLDNHTKVSKFAIVKSKKDGTYTVGVWDSDLKYYDTNAYLHCKSPTVKETILKLSSLVNQ